MFRFFCECRADCKLFIVRFYIFFSLECSATQTVICSWHWSLNQLRVLSRRNNVTALIWVCVPLPSVHWKYISPAHSMILKLASAVSTLKRLQSDLRCNSTWPDLIQKFYFKCFYDDVFPDELRHKFANASEAFRDICSGSKLRTSI